jgi:5'-3' exonuclease
MKTILIDGDTLVYRCGFAANDEPVAHCLHLVKSAVLDIKKYLEPDNTRIFLGGDNNFRLEIDPEYKANRKDMAKPVHYDAIREYLIKWWNAEVVDGMESDDAMGIAQSGDDTCIVTNDKDLSTVPGWHYDWTKRYLFYVWPEEARRFFWTQMLTGDATDNIFGLKGIGPVKAKRMLNESKEESDRLTVEWAYEHAFGIDSDEIFDINYDLLYILQDENDLVYVQEKISKSV